MCRKSVVDWSSFCREVCQLWLEQRSEVLRGTGVVVEIYEAKIGHRKYNRGRWVDGFWVLIGACAVKGFRKELRFRNAAVCY